jgi:hypothetical protein
LRKNERDVVRIGNDGIDRKLKWISYCGELSSMAIDFALVNIQAIRFVDVQFNLLHLMKQLVHSSPE